MRNTPLTHAIVTALLATGYVAAPAAASNAAPAATGAPLDVRYLRESELAAAVVSSGNDPSRWKTPASLRGMALRDAGQKNDPVTAWIPSGSLTSEPARVEAARILHAGVPLLVTGQAGPTHKARAFGLDVPGSVVLYRLLPDGTTHVVTSGDLPAEDVSPALLQGMLSHAPQKPMVSPHSASDSHPEAPVKKYVVEAISRYGTGASTSMHITVARDSRESHDKKNIVVVTQAMVKPFRNGVSAFEWPLTTRLNAPPRPFRANGNDNVLYAVGKYHLETAIAWPAGTSPQVVAAEQYAPVATGTTEHNFQKSYTDSTTYSLGVSTDVAAALADKGISPSGKVAGNFGYQKLRTTQHTVSVNVKDYSIDVGRYNYPQDHARSIRWTYPMDSRFANERGYFSDGKTGVLTTLMTPMMRQAHLETVSGWILDGAYEGEITLSAAAEVENNVYLGKGYAGLLRIPYKVYSRKDHRTGRAPCDGTTVTDPIFGCREQPVASVKIDLGSPYLTRAPTVLLQSFAADDGCLTQASPTTGDLTLASCDISEGNRKQQWTIDEEGRYVNRASRMCLQASRSGTAVAARCNQDLGQKWAWKADRIHSQRDEFRSRLHVNGNAIRASFDASRHQDIPVNTTNALLPPWNNYPQKPTRGSFIPGFTARGEPVPDAYLELGKVGTNERWKTVVLRSGLIR